MKKLRLRSILIINAVIAFALISCQSFAALKYKQAIEIINADTKIIPIKSAKQYDSDISYLFADLKYQGSMKKNIPLSLPAQSSTEKHKTVLMSPNEQARCIGLEVSEDDFAGVKALLHESLPQIYELMLQKTHSSPLSM